MADMVSSFLNLFSIQAQQAEVEMNNRLSRVRAEEGNRVRQASNAAAAAEGSLNRFIQSVNNNRQLKAGGQALEANMVNFYRSDDQLQQQGFSQSIEEAEQAGAAAAAAALNGVAGSVVNDVNLSTQLRDGIMRHAFDDLRDKEAYDTARRAGSIMSQMVGSLDQSLIIDRLDYNQDVAMQQAKPGGRGLQAAILLGRGIAAYSTGGMSEVSGAGNKASGAFSWNTVKDDSYNGMGLA
jgi:hypothetical protein